MRIRNHIFGVIGAILITALLASAFGILLYLLDDYQSNHMNELANHVEIPSPNKSIIVDVFNIEGGATSGDFTQILTRHQSEGFDSRKNFLLLSIDGLKKIKVTWISDTRLDIQYQPGQVYRTAPEWKGIIVTYSELK